MSEEIVACPGCGKKFRLPEGAQSGTFPCTACQADVPYGESAAPPKSKPAARPAAKPAAAAAARPAPAARPAAAPAATRTAPPARAAASAGAARTASRRAATEDREPPPKPSNTGLWVTLGIIGVGAVIGVIALAGG